MEYWVDENISNGVSRLSERGRLFHRYDACSKSNGHNATLDVVGHTIIKYKKHDTIPESDSMDISFNNSILMMGTGS